MPEPTLPSIADQARRQRLGVDRAISASNASTDLPPSLKAHVGRAAQSLRNASQGLVERLGLAAAQVLEVERRVDRAVERHRPDVVRELLRVARPDQGPVREAEVAQLLVADGRPDDVEVVGDRVGRQVRQRGVIPLRALAGVVPGRIDQRAAARRRRRATGRAPPARSRLSMQRMAVLEFTPRGSKPMMSKRLRRLAGNRSPAAALRTNSTPDAPGPPGLTNSEPIREARSVAGSWTIDTLGSRRPGRRSRSARGTLAHRKPPPQSPQRAGGPRRRPRSAAAMASDGLPRTPTPGRWRRRCAGRSRRGDHACAGETISASTMPTARRPFAAATPRHEVGEHTPAPLS